MNNESVNKKIIAESRFLANMSHEIRTPMNSILGFIELVLNSSGLTSKQKNNLETALSSAKYLLRLITSILDISKLQSGSVKIDNKNFDIMSLMGAISSKYQLIVENKNIEYKVELPSGLSGSFYGDVFHIEQVFNCLIDNAIKFTKKGSITVSVINSDKDGFIKFSVEDTGIGIPQNFINTIFDPFVQVDSSSTRNYGGVGLGTTIVKNLVYLLGGNISVKSELNKGTIFIFEIPLERSNCDNINSTNIYNSDYSDSKLKQRIFNILLVDDVENNLELSRIHLSRKGHNVTLARNGIEAIDIYKNKKIDVILMDIHMPIMDGYKATKFIRSLEKDSGEHIPIIALTASVMKDDLQKFRNEGFDNISSKPINFEQLFSVIESVVPEGSGVVFENIVKEINRAENELEPLVINVNLKELFNKIEEKLNLYNPDVVAPFLGVLVDQLPYDSTNKLVNLIDNFEFEEAFKELSRLKRETFGK